MNNIYIDISEIDSVKSHIFCKNKTFIFYEFYEIIVYQLLIHKIKNPVKNVT